MTKEELIKLSRENLRKSKQGSLCECYDEAFIKGYELSEKQITELEAQIEKMKCCGNCRFSESDKLNGTFCHREGCFVVASAKCKLWEN
jgi:hypothetical protein